MHLSGFCTNDGLRKTPTVVKDAIELDVIVRKHIITVHPVPGARHDLHGESGQSTIVLSF